ncbi:MAG TPA: hypothetical protein VMS56_00405 [Thermoanaerobaculia bacterium]|nr:hypothetical protein [Thermoanaerobaculia bacterium]
MSNLAVITTIGIIVLAVLGWFLYKKLARDKIDAFIARRKGDSKIAVPADLIEANERIPVAFALTEKTIFYENSDLEARIDLVQIDEVEYASDLFTGKEITDGRVLRLRSHGHAFEFVIDKVNSEKLESFLPPHRADEPGSVRVVG